MAAYIRILRGRALLVMAAVGVALATGAAYTLLSSPVYRAQMSFVVGQDGGIFRPGFGGSVEPYTQTMRALLTSDTVGIDAIRRSGSARDPEQFLGAVGVTSRPQSGVLEVVFDASTAAAAVRSLSALSEAFLSQVNSRLDQGVVGVEPQDAAVTVEVFDSPRSLGRIEPKPLRNIAFSGVAGVFVGILVALFFEGIARRVRADGLARAAVDETTPPMAE